MKEGRIPNDPTGAKLANDLLAQMKNNNNVKSFASFAKSERLYELNFLDNANFHLQPESRKLVPWRPKTI